MENNQTFFMLVPSNVKTLNEEVLNGGADITFCHSLKSVEELQRLVSYDLVDHFKEDKHNVFTKKIYKIEPVEIGEVTTTYATTLSVKAKKKG